MKFAERGTVDQTLLRIVRGNVREPDQLVGDMYALATCNEIGHRRLCDMMTEFGLSDLEGIAQFILDNSRRATLERIAALPRTSGKGVLIVDGFDTPITLKVEVTVFDDRIVSDFTGTSGVDKKGINCPLVYAKAYACYALKVAIAPEIPNNAASLAPFEIVAPVNTIVNAVHPAPVALRHIVGHFVPDVVFNAFDQIMPGVVPAEGAGCLCNFQVSLRPHAGAQGQAQGRRAEVLTFNSGGSGARPEQDGLNATAFPSGVMTMPVEATEHAGPVIIWRKELRADSGGAGKQRGGLGQYMEVGARAGYEFDIQAMFDRVDHPALGRRGGGAGASTRIALDDGTKMNGKGKQFVPHGRRVVMAFPGGAGYGTANARDRDAVRRDLARGYISAQVAADDYDLGADDIAAVQAAVARGEDV
jgi:N-methylhydantoinase B